MAERVQTHCESLVLVLNPRDDGCRTSKRKALTPSTSIVQ